MFIKDMLSIVHPLVSFEIFPPRKDYPIDTIYETINDLSRLNPNYISVTYSAGGSTSDRTVEIASYIKSCCKIEPVAHLTCINSRRDKVLSTIAELKNHNIHNILALRGDIPKDPDFRICEFPDYRFAKDLISDIKKAGDFCIGGAAYPEGHIECRDMDADILHLSEKIDAGAHFLITQLFFDNEKFYTFKEKLSKQNINIPVMAGIMPVLNKKQITRMAALSGCSMPAKLMRILDRYENSPDALKEAGIAYATDQIVDLLSWGVDGIHIYTMNRPETARSIVGNIAAIRDVLTGNSQTLNRRRV